MSNSPPGAVPPGTPRTCAPFAWKEYGDAARAGLLLHAGAALEWITPDGLAAPWWKVL